MSANPAPTQAPASIANTLSPSTHVKYTADIATSYLGHNAIPPERVKDVIRSIHDALREAHASSGQVEDTSIRELVNSTTAARPTLVPAAPAAPAAETASSEPAPSEAPIEAKGSEVVDEAPVAQAPAAPAAEAAPPAEVATAPSEDAAAKPRRGRRKGVRVPAPLADGGRIRKQPRLKAVAQNPETPAEAPAEPEVAEVAEAAPVAAPSAPKVPEIAWATTEHGIEPTYQPRDAKEVARIRKLSFLNEYKGKKGGFVRCLEDGQVRRMLKKHLKFLEIPTAEYLAKWGLPADFPLVHPTFSKSRANQMKSSELWDLRRSVRAKRGEEVDMDAPNAKARQRAERAERREEREKAAA